MLVHGKKERVIILMLELQQRMITAEQLEVAAMEGEQ